MERRSKHKQRRRLSSRDFLEKASKLWRAGPEVRYIDPDSWRISVKRKSFILFL